MVDQADSVYGRRAWNRWLDSVDKSKYRDTPGFAVDGDPANGANPMAGEVVVTDRLLDAVEAQAPTPQRMLFRPRFGYNMRALGIEDVVEVNDRYRTPNDANAGGYPAIESSSSPEHYNPVRGTG